jgi:hypothetical protein
MRRIYEARHGDKLKSHDIHAKFHKDWVNHSKDREEQTDAKTALRSHKHTLFFSKQGKWGKKQTLWNLSSS